MYTSLNITGTCKRLTPNRCPSNSESSLISFDLLIWPSHMPCCLHSSTIIVWPYKFLHVSLLHSSWVNVFQNHTFNIVDPTNYVHPIGLYIAYYRLYTLTLLVLTVFVQIVLRLHYATYFILSNVVVVK